MHVYVYELIECEHWENSQFTIIDTITTFRGEPERALNTRETYSELTVPMYVSIYVSMYVAICRPRAYHAYATRKRITSCYHATRSQVLNNAHKKFNHVFQRTPSSAVEFEKRSRSSTERSRNSRREEMETGQAKGVQKAEEGIGKVGGC